jgi:hypothetical protein
MKGTTIIAPAGFGLALLTAGLGCAFAQSEGGALLRNPNITIDYVEPKDPVRLDVDINDPNLSAADKDKLVKLRDKYEALKGVRDRLKKSQLLERYSQFLAPLILPTTLRLRAKECGEENAFYSSEDTSINLCYEYVLKFEKKAPTETTPEGITPADGLVGSIVSTLLHETGHALFSIYRIPILGREEDAADQIAGYVMMQFGTDVARTTIKGAAWKWYSQDWSEPPYHDVHSPAQQRFYSFLCMGYGGNPDAFKQFIELGWLPKWRAPNCVYEYQQARLAFDTTVLPHVDPALMAKVRSGTWLRAAEMGTQHLRSSPFRDPTVRDTAK